MEKLSSIIHKSALETYDLVEKNKTLIVQLITMFIPKESRDFILNEKFEFNTYYSKAELEAMDIEKSETKTKKPSKKKSKKTKNESIGLSKSINKSKLRAIIQYIPESLLNFLIFFSYLSLHSIYFW